MCRLRELRLASGLSQEGLARKAGMSTAGLRDLEHGARKNPRTRTAQAIAAALGVSIDAIWPPELPPAA